jgi:hypothetical protein
VQRREIGQFPQRALHCPIHQDRPGKAGAATHGTVPDYIRRRPITQRPARITVVDVRDPDWQVCALYHLIPVIEKAQLQAGGADIDDKHMHQSVPHRRLGRRRDLGGEVPGAVTVVDVDHGYAGGT